MWIAGQSEVLYRSLGLCHTCMGSRRILEYYKAVGGYSRYPARSYKLLACEIGKDEVLL